MNGEVLPDLHPPGRANMEAADFRWCGDDVQVRDDRRFREWERLDRVWRGNGTSGCGDFDENGS